MNDMRFILVLLTILVLPAPMLAGGLAITRVELSDNGDDDGFADTHETVSMRLQVENTVGADLTGVTAWITTESPDIECITRSTIDIGDLAAGEVRLTEPFVFKVADVDRTALGLDELGTHCPQASRSAWRRTCSSAWPSRPTSRSISTWT